MFITKFLLIQNQIRIYHWQTKSYAEHKALGKLYEGLDPLIDSFVESYFGKKGVRKATNTFDIQLTNYKSGSSNAMLNDAIQFVTNDLQSVIEGDTDLQNIRDEMLALFNQTKYLLTLN
jgi:hypothetical protein